jgi:antitoxin ParD1/3/4
MPNVSLTPELDQFAEHCVRSGRYANISEVHRAALRLLQEAEEQRTAFVASLDAAITEGEREGFTSGEDMMAELNEIVDQANARQRASG